MRRITDCVSRNIFILQICIREAQTTQFFTFNDLIFVFFLFLSPISMIWLILFRLINWLDHEIVKKVKSLLQQKIYQIIYQICRLFNNLLLDFLRTILFTDLLKYIPKYSAHCRAKLNKIAFFELKNCIFYSKEYLNSYRWPDILHQRLCKKLFLGSEFKNLLFKILQVQKMINQVWLF